MSSTKVRLLIAGAFLTLTSLWFLGSAAGAYFHTHSFVKSATKVDGRVIRMVDGTSPSLHYPVYVFRDSDGKPHRVYTDLNNYRPGNFQVLDKVPLLYQPDDPENAQRDSFWYLWGHAVRLAILGAVDLLAGLGVLFVAKSQ